MKNVRVARRYAAALMKAAEEAQTVGTVAADLDGVAGLLEKSRELQLLLASPVISAPRKAASLRALFEGRISSEVLTFFLLLTKKGREALIPDIIGQFRALHNERLGVIDVRVTSPAVLEKDQQDALKERLEKYTKKQVRVAQMVDKELMGGLRIQIGDTVLDGSVKHQLELLKDRFQSGGSLQ